MSRIPNFANLDAPYIDQPWDPGNKYTRVQELGHDRLDLRHDASSRPRSRPGPTSSPPRRPRRAGRRASSTHRRTSPGIYFWANGIDWTTEDPADLDACEEFLVNELAPAHQGVRLVPGHQPHPGNYALSQVWNGDARQGLIGVEEPATTPRSTSGGSARRRPSCGWTTGASSRSGEQRRRRLRLHQLHPRPGEQRSPTSQFHGYNTGLKGIEELRRRHRRSGTWSSSPTEQIAHDEVRRGQLARRSGSSTIYSKVKAKAGG